MAGGQEPGGGMGPGRTGVHHTGSEPYGSKGYQQPGTTGAGFCEVRTHDDQADSNLEHTSGAGARG